jgi:hypothetical protein
MMWMAFSVFMRTPFRRGGPCRSHDHPGEVRALLASPRGDFGLGSSA